MQRPTPEKLSSPGLVRALLCAVLLVTPSMAQAAEICVHPFSGGSACFSVFSTVSAVYALIASSYGLGAILIGKPRLTPRAFKLSLLLVPAVSWVAAMLGFTLGGVMGWLEYPHDSSPFFYMDWFSFLVTFGLTTLAVVLIYRLGAAERADAV